ncbi:MAG: hypothetical protein IAE80_26670 [Anaerolinea sp.]|nr:hypothetical protein [Anaerolinea sp.]
MQRRLALTLIAVTALVSFALSTAAQEGEIEVIGGDEATLRELIVRIFTPIQLGGMPDDAQPRVYVGALPEDLPFDIPLPDGTRVIGSSVDLGSLDNGQVYLDVPLPTQEAVDFYRAAFLGGADGWREQPDQMGGGGFTQAQTAPANFCSGDGDTLLSLIAVEGNTGMTHVNLYWQEAYSSACSDDLADRSGMLPTLPRLDLPSGARIVASSSGGGVTNSGYVSAAIQTDLSTADIAAHLSDQLEELGWTLTNDHTVDGSTASTWTLTDEDGDDWTGVLIIVAGGEEDVTAFFQATRQ